MSLNPDKNANFTRYIFENFHEILDFRFSMQVEFSIVILIHTTNGNYVDRLVLFKICAYAE